MGWVDLLPIGLGVGVACYYALLCEPPVMWLWLPILPCVSLCVWWRDVWARRVSVCVLLVMLGVLLAWWQVARMAAPAMPVLAQTVSMDGRVREVSLQEGRLRLLLDDVHIDGLSAMQTPMQVRVTIRGQQPIPSPMMRVRGRAKLFAPSGAALPEAFDFSRYFYFRQIVAIGFLFPDVAWVPATKSQQGMVDAVLDRVSGVRTQIAAQMLSSLGGGSRSGIATALVTGDMMAVEDDVMRDMQLSGLMHILSISGMHMGIVCGLLYAALRRILICIPVIAHHVHVQKLAAVLAMCSGVGYLALAGFPIAAVRACVMTCFFLMAVVLGRQALSLRSLTLAATAVMVLQPSTLMEVSFQLSFLATLALIVGYRWFAEWKWRVLECKWASGDENAQEHVSWRLKMLQRVGYQLGWAVVMSVATSLMVTAITAPLVAFHFHSVSLAGVVANLIAAPLMGLWVMPALVMAMFGMPWGAGEWALQLAGYGIDVFMGLAHYLAHVAWAYVVVPPMPSWSLPWMALGMIGVLLLPKKRYKFMGLALACIAWAGVWSYEMPDVLVSAAGNEVALRDAHGQWWIIKGKSNRSFAVKQWQQHVGQEMTLWRDGVSPALDQRTDVLMLTKNLPPAGAYAGYAQPQKSWRWLSYCDVYGARAWNNCR